MKRLSDNLKFYAKDDYAIEEVIPLIEIILRATPHSKLMLSPQDCLQPANVTRCTWRATCSTTRGAVS